MQVFRHLKTLCRQFIYPVRLSEYILETGLVDFLSVGASVRERIQVEELDRIEIGPLTLPPPLGLLTLDVHRSWKERPLDRYRSDAKDVFLAVGNEAVFERGVMSRVGSEAVEKEVERGRWRRGQDIGRGRGVSCMGGDRVCVEIQSDLGNPICLLLVSIPPPSMTTSAYRYGSNPEH